ncbi:MAG: hypothetical protein ABEH43_04605, partial [Flavobacteriales bacterium]
VTFGFRFEYTLNDIMTGEANEINYPMNDIQGESTTSNPLSAHVMMELIYDLGHLATAECKDRTKLLLF